MDCLWMKEQLRNEEEMKYQYWWRRASEWMMQLLWSCATKVRRWDYKERSNDRGKRKKIDRTSEKHMDWKSRERYGMFGYPGSWHHGQSQMEECQHLNNHLKKGVNIHEPIVVDTHRGPNAHMKCTTWHEKKNPFTWRRKATKNGVSKWQNIRNTQPREHQTAQQCCTSLLFILFSLLWCDLPPSPFACVK